MNNGSIFAALGAVAGFAVAAQAGTVNVSGDITMSTTWTAGNTYNLVDQVYVVGGATLTIEPGTIIASAPTMNGSGSIAVARGSKIEAQGTATDPIIFTTTLDNFSNWQELASTWGNLTIMGNGYIANSFQPGNSASCDAGNVSPMEGLNAPPMGDPFPTRNLYGGGNDDDNSGTLNYVSIRYGGRVIGLANELNGLSLGGIGRGTDIQFVEIMNNVDDGIEIWGGTVNLKNFSIWNIGDDSLDVDQGWRGKGQFGFIVQGYSVDADQGSGVGDNCIETDGAEDSDAQPVTTASLYNLTVIGQPAPGAGDGGTAWRDGARVQYRKSIFMDLGEKLVRPDGDDGDFSSGYGFNNSLTFAEVFERSFTESVTPAASGSAVPAGTLPPNACPDPAAIYTAQSAGDASIEQGRLAEITDSIFFRNLNGAYAESDAFGITVAGGSAPAKGNVVPAFDAMNPDANMPIASLTRQLDDADNDMMPGVTRGGKIMFRVLSIDPRAANDALNCIAAAPNDGFFENTDYRGAFSATDNWLCGWSAADQFGFLEGCDVAAPCDVANIDTATAGSENAIDFGDLSALLGCWGPVTPGCEFANIETATAGSENAIDFADLSLLLGFWGPCN